MNERTPLISDDGARLHKAMDIKIIVIVAVVAATLVILSIAIAVPIALKNNEAELSSMEKARQWMKETPLIDGHNDLPWQFKTEVNNEISKVDLNEKPTWNPTHTDIPRLREGLVGAQFWSAYTSCGSQYKDSIRHVLDQIDVVKRMCDMYPETFEFVTSSQGIREAFENGKIASLIGVEGGHNFQSSLAGLRMLYELGTRYITVTHSCNTPWATNYKEDQTEDPAPFKGLTPFGERVIKEMNRLGMLVDLAHVSKDTMLDVLNLDDQPPVIFSHSSAFAVCDSYRNVQDDVLLKVKENGGVVMVNFYPGYVNCSRSASLAQVAQHINYIKDKCGVECVGLGADYDGVPTVPEGLEDVSKYPDLIAYLIDGGWGESDVKALLGNNLLRAFEGVEKYSADHKNVIPDETTISTDDIPDMTCRTTVYNP
ncbi:dipeptidase 1-like [Amphiura filiformis]|uniref:dipeptidase 1-like n=1 Tax=Amphiura filiformis TaxID=82378 RepID=UPI003B20C5E1